MKTEAVIALCLLAAIIAGGMLLSSASLASAAECTASAGEIAALAQMGDWQRAGEACEIYAHKWETSRSLYDFLLPQDILDGVTEAYERLGTAIVFRDVQECAAVCGELARAAEAIRSHEQLTAANLL